MRIRFVLLLLALGAAASGLAGFERGAAAVAPKPATTEAGTAPASQREQRTGDVIVKFRRSTTLGDVAAALGDARSEASASTAGSGLVLVKPQPGQSDDDVIGSLRARPDVEFAEPNHVVSIAATPTDPLYGSNQWSLPQIGLPAAWDTTTGSAGVIVAVVDTGVDAAHPDLAGKITSGANAGYNFVSNTTNTADDQFHGTFVASIVAMNTNNGQGGAGVCWACMIMPVKVLDSTGSGSTFNVAQGVDWAASHGAKVINLSLGSTSPDSGLQTSVDNAWNAGIIVVAASGNSNAPVLWPAAYPNAIAVGSNNQAGVRSSFSNYGPELDIMAPGEGVIGANCTCNGRTGYYATGSGTSFAAPHVAGVAGLLISAGVTDKNEIRSRLSRTATDMDVAGFDNNTGWGRVNAARAIAPQYALTWGGNTLPATMSAGGAATAAVTVTNAGSSTWPAGGPNPVRFSYHWHNGDCAANNPTAAYGVHTLLSTDVAPGASVTSLNATIQAPATAGTYCLQYDMVHEFVTWFSWRGATTQKQTVTVSAPAYSVTWAANTLPTTISAGATAGVVASFTNAGSATWTPGGPNPVRFSYHWHNGACAAGNPVAIWGTRTLLAGDVAPGGTVTNLSATIDAPPSPGTYCLQYDLVKEFVTWFSSQGAATQSATVTVTPPAYAMTWGSNAQPSSMAANGTTGVTVSFANAGSMAWPAGGPNPVRFSYHWHNGDCAANNPTAAYGVHTLLSTDVAPGASVTSLNATIQAPATAGTYCLQYDMVHEFVTWFSWRGATTQKQTVTVSAPAYSVTWAANTLPATMAANSAMTAAVTFTNSGTLAWPASGPNPVRFSYHWHNGTCAAGNPIAIYGTRTLLQADVPPGGTVTNASATIDAPPSAGTYCLQYDMVQEFVTWFSWQGAAVQQATVTVN